MVKPRVIETNEGIQGEFNVGIYDKMMRSLRDRGWIETDQILEEGTVSLSPSFLIQAFEYLSCTA
jgi:hypothetical protein